jgi:hypothetical protein
MYINDASVSNTIQTIAPTAIDSKGAPETIEKLVLWLHDYTSIGGPSESQTLRAAMQRYD